VSTRPQQQSRSGRTRLLLAPALVAVMAGVIVWWAWNRPPEPPPPPTPVASVPLDQMSLLCPAPTTGGAPASRTALSVVSLADPGDGTGGEVTARTLPDGTTLDGLATTGNPGHDQLALPVSRAADVEITGLGSLAPGLSAFAATTAAGPAGGRLTVIGCPSPTRSWWFVGAGATIDHSSTVIITNPDPTEAIASIQLLGPKGPLDTVGTQGLVVPPRESVAVALSDVAAGQEDLAINVEASQGRVAAATLDTWNTALRPNGTEWLPVAAPPAGDVDLGGIPANGERTLLVTNPGQRSTTVAMSVSDADGTFQTEDLRTISVAAGAVESVELPETLGRGAISVRLSSPTPVTAALRHRNGSPADDVAYAGTATALDGPAAAPAHVGPGVELPELVLTSGDPQQEAAATIEVHGHDGQLLGSETVEIPAGTTRLETPPVPRSDQQRAAYVIVRPEQGAVQASAVYSGDSGISVLALTSPARAALAPQVVGRE